MKGNRMERKIVLFRGVPINDMDRDQLIDTIHKIGEMYEYERERASKYSRESVEQMFESCK